MAYYQEHPKSQCIPLKCGFPCSAYCPMNQVQRLTKPILSIPPTSRWRLRSEPPGIPYQIPDKETYAVPGWLLAQTLSEKKLAYATHVEKMKKLLEHKIEPAPPNFTPIQTFDPARIEKAKVIIESKRMKVTR